MKRSLLGLSFFVVSMLTFSGMSKTPQPQPGDSPRQEYVKKDGMRQDKDRPRESFQPKEDMKRCPDCRKDGKPCRKHFHDFREPRH